MKQNYLKLLVFCLLSLAGMSAYAYDCVVNGIYYNLNTEDNTASVTYESYWSNNTYSGIVNIPESIVHKETTYKVTSIGDDAFPGCYNLTEVTIPNSVTSIGNYAFTNCIGLTKVTIGNNVTSIGDYAFAWCRVLTELTIPNSVTTIGDRAFEGCGSLTEIAIPNSVIYIGDLAFSLCVGLTEMTIPDSVTSMGDNIFYQCIGLERIVVDNDNNYFDSRENCNAIIRTEDNELVAGCKKTSIPNSVTSIGYAAFYGCSGLTEVIIPNSVTSIGYDAFSYCTSLLSITSLNPVPPTIESSSFSFETYENATLHVPTGNKETYAQAENWKRFNDIQEDVSTGIDSTVADKLGKTVIYTLDGKRLQTTNVASLPSGIYVINGKKVVVK